MHDRRRPSRSVLPIPDRAHVGLTTYDAKDPDDDVPADRAAAAARRARRTCWSSCSTTPASASSSAFGGPCNTPTFERLADERPAATPASTRPRCARRRARRCCPGRNHHSVGMGGITEIATSAPGYSSLRPKTQGAAGRDAQAQRLLDRAVRQVPRGAGVGDEPDGPVRPLAERRQRLRALLRLHRRRDEPVRARRSTATPCPSSPTARRRRATTSPRT